MWITLGSIPFTSAAFGPGGGSIHLNRVLCSGSEARLLDCPSGSTWGCYHSYDVGVRCLRRTGMAR